MGYTNYLYYKEITPENWKKIQKFSKLLFKSFEGDLGNGLGKDKPIIRKEEIFFNGKIPNDYETCELTPKKNYLAGDIYKDPSFHPYGDHYFTCCKTAQLDYDLVVRCFYLMVAIVTDGKVSSDGGIQAYNGNIVKDIMESLFNLKYNIKKYYAKD